MANEEHKAQGLGNVFLPNTELAYLLFSDPYLGSSEEGVPNGAFNRELKKLLLNDSAIANVVYGFVNRSVGAAEEAAPAVDTIPDPMPGFVGTPTVGACAEVFFTDYRVIYTFGEVDWIELGRVTRVDQLLVRHRKVVETTLSTGVDAVVVNLPTTDENAAEFAFTLEDLRIFYVKNFNPDSDFLSVVNGLRFADPAITFQISQEPEDGDDYTLVCVFENLSYLT